MLKHRKAAIELGMTTIVVVVLSVVILILGFVFLRSIMCGAINLTKLTAEKAESQLNSIFETSEGEVACIGMGDDNAVMSPGTNYIFCSIRAPAEARYKIEMVGSVNTYNTMPNSVDPNEWVQKDSWTGSVSPGDSIAKRAFTIIIPDNAPEGTISIPVEASKGSDLVTSFDLDFKVSRQGIVKSILC